MIGYVCKRVWQSRKLLLAAGLVWSGIIGCPPLLAADPGTVKAVEAGSGSRFEKIPERLHSRKDPARLQALTDLKAWMDKDPAAAERVLWEERGYLVRNPPQAELLMRLFEQAMEFKPEPWYVAEMRICKACCLVHLGKLPEALDEIQDAHQEDVVVFARVVVLQFAPVLVACKKSPEALDALQAALLALPADYIVWEQGLKQRIAILNAQDKSAQALAEAKSFFNVASMERTGEAMLILDRQIALSNLADPSAIARFRQEQTDGAQLSPEGKPRTSSVLAAIKVSSAPYDGELAKRPDASFGDLVSRCCLLLVADKPDEALVAAKRAFGQADQQQDVQTARELIARCMKAQDGTVGRANAWISGAH